LTVRHGPDVAKEGYESLDEAVAELGRRATAVRAEGGLGHVSALRDFEPSQQVNARLEISGRGLLRPPTAGVDVLGDGSMVAFRGSIRRVPIEPADDQSVFDAVRAVLDGAQR
jgi:hypothetical protein